MTAKSRRRKAAGSTQEKIGGCAGMTLIELIVGLAISSVVSLMAAQFFSIAVRLHRSSTEISALQKEGQVCLSQITRAVMGAEEFYFHDDAGQCLLILGREESGQTGFSGEIFYYNRKEHRLYADVDYHGKYSRETLFNSLRAQAEMGRLETSEYLLSNKVEDFGISLSRDIREMKSLGNHTYGNTEKFCVTAELTMQYHESRSYVYTAKAMPRKTIAQIMWNDSR